MNQTPLIAPTFLFRFAVPIRHLDVAWDNVTLDTLGKAHLLPSFGELEDRPVFANLHGAWNEDGLYFQLDVRGKKQSAWCRETRAQDSDGLHLCVDTRDTHTIHRAGRFCHYFAFLPFGGGRQSQLPVSQMLDINRARENPKPVAPRQLGVRSERRVDGYRLAAHIPATALTGFDTEENRRLGFTFAVIDREMGWQTFSIGAEFPFFEDPSLWGTLELTL